MKWVKFDDFGGTNNLQIRIALPSGFIGRNKQPRNETDWMFFQTLCWLTVFFNFNVHDYAWLMNFSYSDWWFMMPLTCAWNELGLLVGGSTENGRTQNHASTDVQRRRSHRIFSDHLKHLIQGSFDPSRKTLGSEASSLLHHQNCIKNLRMFAGAVERCVDPLLILPKCSRHLVKKPGRDAYVLTISDVLMCFMCLSVFTCFGVLGEFHWFATICGNLAMWAAFPIHFGI